MRLRHLQIVIALLISLLSGGISFRAEAKPVALSRVDVQLVTDEADAVLAILGKRLAREVPTEEDWQRLSASEGYIRLSRREAAIKRPFTPESFKTFVLGDDLLAKTEALFETLANWKKASVTGAAQRALAYLPRDATIRAKIYPEIKPQTNSFVFEVKTNPAVFLYLDPSESKDQFENTLAHELHYIGYGSGCPIGKAKADISRAPRNIQDLLDWIGGFGEGFAMLAAAGGPDVHPHRFSKPEDRARWDRDVTNFNNDLKKVEQFFLDVANNKLREDERNRVGFSFFGVQGPWYTVGWKMAVTIEKTYGRKRLIECICDQRKLLATYDQAAIKHNRRAKTPFALWSPGLLENVRKAF